ncbi:hypothetical protein LguiA_006008 [Lonicera macranthoides]
MAMGMSPKTITFLESSTSRCSRGLLLLPSHSVSFPSNSNSITTSTITSLKSRNRIPSSLLAKASSTTTTGFSPEIGDILGDVSIFTASGEPVMFKDLWDQCQGVAVVALLRHFGCPCCWELASALKESKARFDSAGVKLIAIGIGTPNKARILAERAKVFSRFEALQKAVKNYTIEATPDDRSSVLQQGGMLVFKGKQLLYARKDEGTGDHAPLDDIFDICCKVPVA